MSAFIDAAAALHADENMSVEAIFTPAGGSPLPAIRVIRSSPVEDVVGPGLRPARAQRETVSILVADLPAAPKRGDTLAIGEETFVLEGDATLDNEATEYVVTLGG